MKILYHIVAKSDIILSNLSTEKARDIFAMDVFYKFHNKEGIREEKRMYMDGWIYLSIEDITLTRKIFNRYFDCLIAFYKPLIFSHDDMATKYNGKIRRLTHNISNYNAKIQDELENIIPSNITPQRRNWKNSINLLENLIRQDINLTARTLLHILKNVKLINAEMDVYDIMNSEEPILNVSEHPIRKVIDLSIQPFFLELIDKNVNISVGDSNEKVYIDFPTLSVVLGHIFDNAVKYTAENSILSISFSYTNSKVVISISMTSTLVLPNEINDIFLENHSGFWATKLELHGHGIGMYYAKKLVEINNGEIEFCPGEESYKLNGIPYAKNTIRIILKRAI